MEDLRGTLTPYPNPKVGLGAEISKDLTRSLRIGEDEISGSGNLKTATSMAL